jgi:hypothetical protein
MGRAASVRDHCGILRVGLAPPGWRSAVRRSASKAGICSGTLAVLRSLEWPGSRRVLRVLAEITETAPREALSAAAGLLGGLAPAAAQVLLHGEDTAARRVLRLAASRRLDARIGLEDVLHLPGGAPRRATPPSCARHARSSSRHRRARGSETAALTPSQVPPW